MKHLLQIASPLIILGSSFAQAAPNTLLEMSNIHPKVNLERSILVMIDYQNEYVSGRLPLFDIKLTLAHSKALLELARSKSIPVVHVIHDGGKGGLFDLNTEAGRIIPEVAPIEGERVIQKNFPNSFAQTDLLKELKNYPGRDQLILAGLMTHMCVASTASAAVDHGYFATIVSETTTTRDLAGPSGETVSAKVVKAAALASIKDRFAVIIPTVADLLKK